MWKAALLWIPIALLGLPAWAHRPIEENDTPSTWQTAIEVDRPDVSQVAYREITPEHPAVWFVFEAEAGQEILFSVGVPRIERLRDFRPAVAVVGPGFPAVELPVAMPPGAGGVVLEPLPQAREFHEPFTGTDDWILLEQRVRFEAAGTYYAVAYVPAPQVPEGKLFLVTGTRERFGLRDLFSFPRWVNEVRAFHEVRPRRWWIPITIGATAVVGGGVLVGVWLARR